MHLGSGATGTLGADEGRAVPSVGPALFFEGGRGWLEAIIPWGDRDEVLSGMG
jgi:hypothetical protein